MRQATPLPWLLALVIVLLSGSHAPAEDSRVAWLRSLLDNSEGSSPREFIDSLKVDLYPDEVYSFTPRGDVFSFPSISKSITPGQPQTCSYASSNMRR